MSNHCPPKVFTTVSSAAMLSPQPARPRRQIPATLPGWFSLAANPAICAQVGQPAVLGEQRRLVRADHDDVERVAVRADRPLDRGPQVTLGVGGELDLD